MMVKPGWRSYIGALGIHLRRLRCRVSRWLASRRCQRRCETRQAGDSTHSVWTRLRRLHRGMLTALRRQECTCHQPLSFS